MAHPPSSRDLGSRIRCRDYKPQRQCASVSMALREPARPRLSPAVIGAVPSLVTRPQDRGRLVSLRTVLQIRETEVIDPHDLESRYPSGPLPDDEDVGGPGQESDDFELSGSGDLDEPEDPRVFPEVIHPLVPLDNHIPERAGPGRVPSEPRELEENEVIPKRLSPPVEGVEEISNRVSMSSTAQGGSIFERTEVLAALIVGGGVGILFAIFLVLLLMYRMKKKDEGSYDLGKKPIYKKAPTNEFYA